MPTAFQLWGLKVTLSRASSRVYNIDTRVCCIFVCYYLEACSREYLLNGVNLFRNVAPSFKCGRFCACWVIMVVLYTVSPGRVELKKREETTVLLQRSLRLDRSEKWLVKCSLYTPL